jgi:malonate decarboxylase delta subunit
MEHLHYRFNALRRASGDKPQVLVGVVASGNLEVLAERVLAEDQCEVDIQTAAEGFSHIWEAVVADFVENRSPGGLKFSINDGGARPDMVGLRLAQAVSALEATAS